MDDTRRQRAHATVDAALDRILAHDMAGLAALWAPDGTMTFPFAAPGSPRALAGRDAVAAYGAGYNDLLLPAAVVDEVRHTTGDPDTLVVEFAVRGTVVASGADYTLRYVAVVTVGPEGITAYRDYWSPLEIQQVLGRTGLAETTR
ncbi:nuclear transport factor 2 family protein [Pseudonocardia sp. ICBG1293]|uniref:nuclear transport factor 2 family protein n=1 Tax=Pseudonocardia sp. ICBG1293 TaxID=2844382 RepID=UPI001CCF9C51|nr:nuclear transport factor 2 family protein [Pseudonocardia sp. ICBG1293]